MARRYHTSQHGSRLRTVAGELTGGMCRHGVCWLCDVWCPAVLVCFFFFFKQKTAYEISTRDWSSDVCSSDLYEQVEVDNDFPSGDNEVHEHVLLDGRVEYLPTPMDHYAFPDIATFVEKHDRYSSWEAAARTKADSADENSLRATPFGTPLERKRWLRNLATRAPFRPSLRFIYHYIWRQGFRDGYRGWMLCGLLA